MKLSARNQLPGTVQSITLGAVMAEVVVKLFTHYSYPLFDAHRQRSYYCCLVRGLGLAGAFFVRFSLEG